ncbi:villin like protein quail isoform X2 [Arctopsyche grandis]|uniref:villin like protein quail isoform X2 n=1 Tax=Arctopsyche grandis TaxID=121162 RepID=UPI00406D8107
MHRNCRRSDDTDDGLQGIIDPMFRTVPKENTTFLIWRVENSSIVLLPKSQYGTFYDGDCYIIYASSIYGHPAGPNVIKRDVKNAKMESHIHFWLGAKATPDSTGAAAYKAVELDAHLGGSSVQHREVQGHESARLKSYFKDGIKLFKSNGADSKVRLYRVYGRCPVFSELDDVSWQHFCSSGVFILETPDTIFIWIGRAANTVEKLHGTKIALKTGKATSKGQIERPIVFLNDGYEQTLRNDKKLLFQKYLNLQHRHVKTTEEEVNGKEKGESKHSIRLYKCWHTATKYRIEEIKPGPLLQSDLNSNEVYILDNGVHGIWIWVGRKVSLKERAEAIRNARGFVKKKHYPSFTPVIRVPEDNAPLEFKTLFKTWKNSDMQAEANARVAKAATTRFDAQTLHHATWLSAQTQLVDDGTGVIKIWRVTTTGLVEILSSVLGIFFNADCYVVFYTYHHPEGESSIIYYWIGSCSTPELRKIAEKGAREMHTKLDRIPMNVRVIQGKEPAHFLQIFKGRMITFVGKATDCDSSGMILRSPSHYLVRVSGKFTREARGTEVVGDGREKKLDHRGVCYILRSGARCWVWCATNATGDEREVAKQMASTEHVLIMQGKEKADFWDALGNKRTILTADPQRETEDILPARLFYVSMGSPGYFEEIVSFSQADLSPEYIVVLDAHCCVYVWTGAYSCTAGKDSAINIALKYLRSDPSGRDDSIPIMVLSQGSETPTFTGFFPTWDRTLWTGHKSYERVRRELEGKFDSDGMTVNNNVETSLFDQYDKYPLSVLRGPSDKLPSSIDPLLKELYLTHDDFVSTFGVPYNQFKTLPIWKQKDFKKGAGLF